MRRAGPVFAWYAAGGIALDGTRYDQLRRGQPRPRPSKWESSFLRVDRSDAAGQKPIYTIPNGFNKQAMAWVNNLGGGNPNLHPVIVKNGGTSGFGTVIAIYPAKNAAIFIGMNQVGANPAATAVEILRHLP
jgi:CubicO group peptidase (beta-lactamase class C family)